MHGRLYEQLKTARKVARIRQTDLAAAVGWETHTQVSHFENGSRDTYVAQAERWADACGFEIVLVPKGNPDPEGLADLVSAIRDPAARQVLASLARLVRKPSRYWMHLLDDIRHEIERADRDEAREEG